MRRQSRSADRSLSIRGDLVSPGNPDQAARFAKEAASVTHGGNGIYGGIFVAVCISYAFIEQDIRKILEKGLSYIPAGLRVCET